MVSIVSPSISTLSRHCSSIYLLFAFVLCSVYWFRKRAIIQIYKCVGHVYRIRFRNSQPESIPFDLADDTYRADSRWIKLVFSLEQQKHKSNISESPDQKSFGKKRCHSILSHSKLTHRYCFIRRFQRFILSLAPQNVAFANYTVNVLLLLSHFKLYRINCHGFRTVMRRKLRAYPSILPSSFLVLLHVALGSRTSPPIRPPTPHRIHRCLLDAYGIHRLKSHSRSVSRSLSFSHSFFASMWVVGFA